MLEVALLNRNLPARPGRGSFSKDQRERPTQSEGCRGQHLVGDQPRAVLPARQHEATVVERLEFGPMPDADHGRIGQALGDALHEGLLRVAVERGGGLVHHDDVRRLNEELGEGQALLFASRESAFPRDFLVDAVHEMPQFGVAKGLL